MRSRFLSELTPADVVTLGNVVIGFLAVVIAPTDPEFAARLVLLAAVADGIDGVLARAFGGSDMGPYLDSLADVPSFAIAPAMIVFVVGQDLDVGGPGWVDGFVLLGVPAVFVALAVLRLGAYSAYDTAATRTVGAPTTLAATIIAVSMLTVHWTPDLVVLGTAVLAIAMIAPVSYPDLLARDALIMGVIHVLAVAVPRAYGRVFPYALLTLAVAYLLLGPHFYWGETERRLRQPPKGKRSKGDRVE